MWGGRPRPRPAPWPARQRADRRHPRRSGAIVLGQEYPFFGQRKAHDILVHGTLLKLAHREHIMAVRPESPDGGEIAAFIREEAHGPALLGTERQDGFVRDGVSRVGQSCPNIVCGQPWICVQEVFDRRTFRKLA